jgi:hypothetical protein
MTDVFVSRYRHTVMQHNSFFSVKHPLARRMTPLQKAALEGLERWKNEDEKDFNFVFRELQTPIFFASAFGELDATIKEADYINQKSLPVSPAAFQHSVQNCAPGYFSIINALDTPSLSISSGFLTLDKTLFLAWQKVLTAQTPAICVLAAHEQGEKNSLISSFGELFLVHNNTVLFPSGTGFALTSCHFEWTKPEQETLGSLFPLLRLDQKSESFCRTSTNSIGEKYSSHWRALP